MRKSFCVIFVSTCSDDEGEPEEDDDDEDEEEDDYEEDDDVEEEDSSVNQVSSPPSVPRPPDASSFLCFPSPDKLLKLGTKRALLFEQQVVNTPCYEYLIQQTT